MKLSSNSKYRTRVLVEVPHTKPWTGELRGYSTDGFARVIKDGTKNLRYIHPSFVRVID